MDKKINNNAPTCIIKLICSPSKRADRDIPTIGIIFENTIALLGSNILKASMKSIKPKTVGKIPR